MQLKGYIHQIQKHLNQHNFESAESVFQEAIDANPDTADLYEIHAQIAFKKGDLAEAHKRYEMLLELYPEHIGGYLGKIEVFFNEDALDKAEELIQEAIAAFPNHPQPRERHGFIAMKKKNFEQAAERYQKMKDTFPNSPGGYIGLGKVLIQLKKYEEAETIFAETMKRFPQLEVAKERHAFVSQQKHITHENGYITIDDNLSLDMPYVCVEPLITTISEQDFLWLGTGKKDVAEYLRVGGDTAALIKNLMNLVNVPLEPGHSLLDYGSGFGRVARHLAAMQGRNKVAVAEPRPDARLFCQDILGLKAYPLQEPYDECPFDESFHFIFAGSVFTHICVDLWSQVFKLFDKILLEKGAILFTTASDYVVELVEDGSYGNLHPLAAKTMTTDFRFNGYGYANYPKSIEDQYKPDEESSYRYGRCMVKPSWVNSFVENNTPFKVCLFQRCGWEERQDIYIVTRRNLLR